MNLTSGIIALCISIYESNILIESLLVFDIIISIVIICLNGDKKSHKIDLYTLK